MARAAVTRRSRDLKPAVLGRRIRGHTVNEPSLRENLAFRDMWNVHVTPQR